MQLYPDSPRSKGVENALKRARQMVELSWTPVANCPIGRSVITAEGKKYIDCYMNAWLPQTGAIYSSVRQFEKFIGFNVSHETFMTAASDPRSVVYTKPQHGQGLRMFGYYGIVCSAFVSYVCDLPMRVPCSHWPYYPQVSLVDSTDLRNLQLCDIVLDTTKHIAIITGLERDVEGNVHYITVSESTLPMCRATRFSVEEFRGYWLNDGYKIYRYAGLDGVTYTPSPYVHLEGDPWLPVPVANKSLMPTLGNKANYMAGEPVELDVLEAGWEAVCIAGPESHKLPIEDARAVFTPQIPGFYTAYCVAGEKQSEPVEFCLAVITAEVDQPVLKPNDALTVSFHMEADDIPVGWIVQNLTWGYRGGRGFTAEEAESGKVVIRKAGKNPDPAVQRLEPGDYRVFVQAKNKYGMYKSAFVDFRVEE